MNPLTAKYLNRLSDLMFILCRVASMRRRDPLEARRHPLSATDGRAHGECQAASRWALGGADSSQARKPVRASSLIARDSGPRSAEQTTVQ